MATNSFGARSTLTVDGKTYTIHKLEALEKHGFSLARMPYSIKVMIENVLRREDGVIVTTGQIEALARWNGKGGEREVSFMPARVLLQDFTGVPVVADLAVMRDAIKKLGGNPAKISPLQPVDLVIDHSVQVDSFGSAGAFAANAQLEFERNQERYLFLRWGQGAFDNFRVVPPDTGHRAPGESRISRAGGFLVGQGRGVSRHRDRHRFAYDDDQRARRRRLGRRWNRSRSGDAWALDADADSRSDRLSAGRRAASRRDRDRPGADGHADAAQERRGRQVRRIFRAGPQVAAGGRSRDARQHVARVWRDDGIFSGRRSDAHLFAADGPQREPDQADRGVLQGAGPVQFARCARAEIYRHARARPGQRRAEHGRAAPSAGSSGADCGEERFPPRAGQGVRRTSDGRCRRADEVGGRGRQWRVDGRKHGARIEARPYRAQGRGEFRGGAVSA